MKHAIPLLFLGACINLGPSPVAPEAANSSIEIASEPTFDGAGGVVQCDGPEDELALLGGLCGTRLIWASATTLEGGSWGRYMNVEGLELYVMGDPQDMGTLQFAAFVTVDGRESVSEGLVHPTLANDAACSSSFEATASLLWRGTTLHIPWIAVVPC